MTIHLMRQAVSERLRENDKRRRPVITAPTMLVATNSIAKSIIDTKIAPKMPVSKIERIGHKHTLASLLQLKDVEIRTTAR